MIRIISIVDFQIVRIPRKRTHGDKVNKLRLTSIYLISINNLSVIYLKIVIFFYESIFIKFYFDSV